MYDLKKGRDWTFNAPIFEIPFGAKHISIHVEFPPNAPVVSDGYRQFLRYANGEQHDVEATDFSEIVRRHRPQWLIDLIHSFAPDSPSNDDIRKELQKIIEPTARKASYTKDCRTRKD
jgi:hypothetical protein